MNPVNLTLGFIVYCNSHSYSSSSLIFSIGSIMSSASTSLLTENMLDGHTFIDSMDDIGFAIESLLVLDGK